MDLGQKVRTAACGLMLGAATMGALGGCVSFTQWETAGTENIPTGVIRTETKDAGNSVVRARSFDISDPYIEGDRYKTRIVDSLEDITYRLRQDISIQKFNTMQIQQRDEKTQVFGPIFFSVGILGGLATGMFLSQDQPNQLGGALIGTAGGALVGGALAALMPPIITKTEERRQIAGTMEESSVQGVNSQFLKSTYVYMNQPSSKVKWGIVGRPETNYTNTDGTIVWVPDKPYMFVSREGLEKMLYDLPLVREIKPDTRNRLRQRLLEGVYTVSNEFPIETREQADKTKPGVVQNAAKFMILDYFTLDDETVYTVVHQFIDEEINSSMRTLEFSVKDDVSHVPIEGANFEFETDSPSKSDLLGKYFTGGLKTYSERFVLDYLNGKGVAESVPSKFQWLVYSPSNIFLEVTHPDYNFVNGELKIGKNAVKTVYMIDKGSKVRLEKAGSSSGRIE